ncbi:MAG: hypothetical protein ACJAWX_000741, partial [Algoriphagus sp.]
QYESTITSSSRFVILKDYPKISNLPAQNIN